MQQNKILEIVPSHNVDDTDVKLIRESLSKMRNQRISIYQKFDITPYAPDEIKDAINQVHITLQNNFIDAGVIPPELPPVAIIPRSDLKEINKKLANISNNPLSGEILGTSSYLDGAVVLFSPNESGIDVIGRVFHESFHQTGTAYFSAELNKSLNRLDATPVRLGFELFNSKTNLSPWVLEEGVTSYEESRFKADYSQKMFPFDYYRRKSLLVELTKNHKNTDFIKLSNGYRYSEWFLHYMTDQSGPTFTVHERSALSGSIIEAIMTPMTSGKQTEFIHLLYRARKDLKLTPEIASAIDSSQGRGTYSKILIMNDLQQDNKQTYDKLWNLVQELRFNNRKINL